MHTSTVTVAVIDPTVIAIEVKDNDLKLEWFSGTGCGGQHKNKHQNSCRLTHIPTGITQTAQTRSRENSFKLAHTELIKLVNEKIRGAKTEETSAIRKNQVGSGMRGDKMRTYRFQDDVVKDHATNKSSSVKKVMAGNFNLLW